MEGLYFSGNNVSDVSPLKDLANLKYLDLSDNSISDISPLKHLVKLEYLDLGDNATSDDLPQGQDLLGNTISDVSPLTDLVKLEYLDLSDSNISDISPLTDLVNLRELDLRGNTISDVSPLKNLVKLEWLNLSRNTEWTGDLEFFSTRNTISDISPLTNLVKLEYLDLSDSNISDISPLKHLVNLRELNLKANNISDVSPLTDLVKLSTLDLRNNRVHNASTLSHLNAKILVDRGVRLAAHKCGTLMSDTLEPLDRVRVYREYEQTKISDGISDYQGLTATVKAAVAGDADRNNRTWTTDDTVADETGSRALTVKFLSATEAGKLLRNDVRKRLLIENYANGKGYYEIELAKYEGTFVDPSDIMIQEIKRAAKAWCTGNITWRYVEPNDSRDSDIRIAFIDKDQLPALGTQRWVPHLIMKKISMM